MADIKRSESTKVEEIREEFLQLLNELQKFTIVNDIPFIFFYTDNKEEILGEEKPTLFNSYHNAPYRIKKHFMTDAMDVIQDELLVAYRAYINW